VTVTAASVKRLGEQTTITKSAGAYIEQVFGLDDRFFVTGSVRFDRNSSTGFEAKTITYPKAAASWLLPWFDQGTFSSLRLRGSFGQAGQQPVARGAETYTATQAAIAGVVSLHRAGQLRRRLLKAGSTEFEAALIWGCSTAVAFEFTAFQETDDALVNVTTPPSAGNPAGSSERGSDRGHQAVLNARC
jgi:hypothetical protein